MICREFEQEGTEETEGRHSGEVSTNKYQFHAIFLSSMFLPVSLCVPVAGAGTVTCGVQMPKFGFEKNQGIPHFARRVPEIGG